MVISNVSEVREADEEMLVTLLLLMLEVPGRPGTAVPCEALEVVGVGAEVCVKAHVGVETEEKRRKTKGWPNYQQQS